MSSGLTAPKGTFDTLPPESARFVAEHGDGVEVLAAVDGHPVAVQEGNRLAISFHPELSGETRLHARFIQLVQTRA